jgi:hypothetical protein
VSDLSPHVDCNIRAQRLRPKPAVAHPKTSLSKPKIEKGSGCFDHHGTTRKALDGKEDQKHAYEIRDTGFDHDGQVCLLQRCPYCSSCTGSARSVQQNGP